MRKADVLVIGAGPAGMAAAARAADSGARVILVDDNASAGGQIWRGATKMRWRRPGIETIFGTQAIARGSQERTVLFEAGDQSFELGFGRLILATGARELFLPFPGWTLPGVFGAGGLQAMAKSGLPVRGKTVILGGSGPLLVAVAAHLRQAGARIKLIAEQASARAIAGFAFSMLRYPAKLAQAAGLRMTLAGIRYLPDCWVEAAEGRGRLERVRLRRGNKNWTEECDYAGIAYGLRANTELGSLLGCGMQVNEWQQTAARGVYAAGECTDVGGVDLAVVEGEIAGYAACDEMDRARRLFGQRRRARKFAEALARAFALREELRTLPRPTTIVCRCEDVAYEKLQHGTSARDAKLHTRCGMGACQARICGAATEFLFGWKEDSVRPPLLPARAGSLAFGEDFE